MFTITREQERNALARNLRRILLEKGMNQSDLARLMWPGKFVIDNRGYKQPINKDRISAWVNGKVFPNKQYFILLLKTLNITEEMLLNKQKQFLSETSLMEQLAIIEFRLDLIVDRLEYLCNRRTMDRQKGFTSEIPNQLGDDF